MSRFGQDVFEDVPVEAVKDGRVFRAFFDGQLASGSSKNFLFKTGLNENLRTYLRQVLIVSSDSPLKSTILAGVDLTSLGTEAESFNLNLGSERLAADRLYEDPIYTGGVIRDVDLIPAGSQGGSNIAAGSRNFTGFMRIIPPNLAFVLKVENIGTQTAEYVVQTVWEEVP